MKTFPFIFGLFLIFTYACTPAPAEPTNGPVHMVLEPDPNFVPNSELAGRKAPSPSDSLEQARRDSIYFAEQKAHMARIEQEETIQIQQLLQKDKPNIRDYYLALPDGYVFDDCSEADYISMELRKKGITKEMPEIGYLQSRLAVENMDYGLYKDRTNQRDIIACMMEAPCGEYPCLPQEGFMVLLPSGTWQDITEEVMLQDPLTEKIWKYRVGFLMSYYLELPKQGTAIQIMSCKELDEGISAKSLGSMVWENGYFTAQLNKLGEVFFEKIDKFLLENPHHIRD
ncbi:MAG: hypothetical protein AAFR61_12220 [Bacteroidota bacterium]